ncbi:MAG: UDP-N-acetylglucosamine--N-acetylmuramyl-(pentapeptide) pyrophosphoryl-undecaprenol N-acetylglucosamine transferase [Ilumatobacter sp.]|uniref:UDP-N-acetylglucosamine--N-acetylmuramyl- (pentapeptide) pyrophosphoryl-undecaprenol N-acetylglucosamine transferase n=1 Tax=Ilumatobacter sp. TaxID=1967498 RepID=UPI00391D3C77
MSDTSRTRSAANAAATFAVVTGGGTSGHVLPALAVADALVADGVEATEVHYVGCERGIETRLVPETPYPRTFFDVVGFQRSLTRRNLGFVPKMLRARRAAVTLLRELRPAVVVSVGGYASMPAVFAAKKLGIPIVVVSYDRRPGRASRLAARSAVACAVAFDNSPLPRARMTGAPVRQAVLDVDRETDRAAARDRLGIPNDRFFVAVMGGSLGSGVLNDAIAEYLTAHREDVGLAVRQVAGERFATSVAPVGDGSSGVVHQVVGYERDMVAIYAGADLLIGRGGASTVHEVAATGTPAILVPWAGAADDHQSDNVAWLSEVGAAVLVDEAACRDGALGVEIERLRGSVDARRALADAARQRGEVHRSGALASLIREVALTSRSS